MKIVLLCLLLFTPIVRPEMVYSVKPGDDYSKYSDKELRKRVQWLEKAVEQLQQKVFNLSQAKTVEKKEEGKWKCHITVMSDKFEGVGESRGVAEGRAIDNCKKAQKGTSLFCKVPRCFEQK